MIDKKVNVKPFAYALSMVEGKWKMHILFWLWKYDVMRYGEIKNAIGEITHKMLSTKLKELEHDGLIIRTEYPQIPPKVEYKLSKKGISIMPVLDSLCKWGSENYNESNKE